MKILNNLDLVQNEVRNARLQNLATAPGSPATGQIYYDTALGYARIWSGSAWQRADVSAAVTSVGGTSPIVSSGGTTPSISISAATTSAAGSMSASDKQKLDDATSAATASKLVLRDASSRFRAADPADPQDVATKGYVDGVAQGLDIKEAVHVATTANITLSGTQTVDGHALQVGDRVLVKNQTTGADNGIYVVASGAWTRATDADVSSEVTQGMFTFVAQGTTQADTGWVLTTNNPITLGTTALTFAQFSGGGSYAAGDGLTLTGAEFDVVGTADRITVNPDSVDIASTYAGQSSITTLGTITTGTWTGTAIAVANGGTGATDAATARSNLSATGKFSQTIGNNSSTSIVVTHNLASRDVQVTVYDSVSYAIVYPDVAMTTTNTVTLDFSVAPTTNQYRVVVVG